jgi:hypothetical protein
VKKSKLFEVHYTEFGLRSQTRPTRPIKNPDYLLTSKDAIHIKKYSATLEQIFFSINKKGCKVGNVEMLGDSVVILINREDFEKPLLIFKEGVVVYDGNVCSVNKKISNRILKELGLKTHWE